MHSFEVSLGYESVDRSTFSMKRGALHVENVVRPTLSYPNETSKECGALHVENVVRSTFSYPNETSKECIQFL
jgi:hypothetical protein